jgi:hypothetical protein
MKIGWDIFHLRKILLDDGDGEKLQEYSTVYVRISSYQLIALSEDFFIDIWHQNSVINNSVTITYNVIGVLCALRHELN